MQAGAYVKHADSEPLRLFLVSCRSTYINKEKENQEQVYLLLVYFSLFLHVSLLEDSSYSKYCSVVRVGYLDTGLGGRCVYDLTIADVDSNVT